MSYTKGNRFNKFSFFNNHDYRRFNQQYCNPISSASQYSHCMDFFCLFVFLILALLFSTVAALGFGQITANLALPFHPAVFYRKNTARFFYSQILCSYASVLKLIYTRKKNVYTRLLVDLDHDQFWEDKFAKEYARSRIHV